MTGQELRRLREHASLSQVKLGKLVGLSGGAIHEMESGRRLIPPQKQEQIKRVLGIPVVRRPVEGTGTVSSPGRRNIRLKVFMPPPVQDESRQHQQKFYTCRECLETYTDADARDLCCRKGDSSE